MTDAPESDASFPVPVSGACVMGIRLGTRAGNTGSVYRAPGSTSRVGKKHCRTVLFAITARWHGCSVHRVWCSG